MIGKNWNKYKSLNKNKQKKVIKRLKGNSKSMNKQKDGKI